MEKGTFYWISGLSGAGKTTIGTMFYNYLKEKKDNVVLIDGDVLREITGDQDFSEEGRDNRVMRNARLFQLLTDQGIDVENVLSVAFDGETLYIAQADGLLEYNQGKIKKLSAKVSKLFSRNGVLYAAAGNTLNELKGGKLKKIAQFDAPVLDIKTWPTKSKNPGEFK